MFIDFLPHSLTLQEVLALSDQMKHTGNITGLYGFENYPKHWENVSTQLNKVQLSMASKLLV